MKEPVTNKQKLYYTIGEVSDMFNVNQSLLRYWETEFKTINPKPVSYTHLTLPTT